MRGRRRRPSPPQGAHSPAQPLGSILQDVTEELGLGDRLRALRAVERWPELAGPSIAARTRAREVRDGKLVVEVVHSSWIHELSLLKPMLLGRLRRGVPGTEIEDILFLNRGDLP